MYFLMKVNFNRHILSVGEGLAKKELAKKRHIFRQWPQKDDSIILNNVADFQKK